MKNDVNVRHEFVLLFDATNSNPNGDPDAGNLPRVDPETMHGLVSDVALKRKVRDYLAMTRGERMFIQSEHALNTLKEMAADELDEELTSEQKGSKQVIPQLRSKLCELYWDIRMFGAVLSTGEGQSRLNAGQVRGPVQVAFARSIDPVLPMEITITRQARTTVERQETGTTEMGRKAVVPYGLYRAHGYFNPYLARDTGVTEADLDAFWNALANLFEFDRSAARPQMAVQSLVVFTHESPIGNAPSQRVLGLVEVSKKSEATPPRSIEDYEVRLPDDGPVPELSGVTASRLV